MGLRLRVSLRFALMVGLLWASEAFALATGEVSYRLLHAAAPKGTSAPPVVFAATLDLAAVPRTGWDEHLFKIRQGEFNAVHLLVPPTMGSEGLVSTTDLTHVISRAAALNLKVLVGAPESMPAGGWEPWLSAIRAAAQQQPGTLIGIQTTSHTPDLAALQAGARAKESSMPLVAADVSVIPISGDPQRPYRQPEVSLALRRALAEGATLLVWGPPFAGFAPPLSAATPSPVAPLLSRPESSLLPLSYYEARLFGQVLRSLGPALAQAVATPGASADAPGVHVVQRNVGTQGFLFVRVDNKEMSRFRLSFTDPQSGQRLTLPTLAGLTLRTFGVGARILPINLPVPGATIRYSTAEVFGLYQVGQRTAIFVTDDRGAPNEIALGIPTDQPPTVLNALVPPVWDKETHTLTLGFVPSFDDTFLPIGDNLLLVIVPTERAQRTWGVRHPDGEVPVITSAYLVGEAKTEEKKWTVEAWMQQGKAAMAMLLPSRPRYLAVNRAGVRVGQTTPTEVLLFTVESEHLAEMKRAVPLIQVMKEALFEAGEGGAEFARPDFDTTKWKKVNLTKPPGAGRYRFRLKLPIVEGWSIPWLATLELKGTATVYLNGHSLGLVAGGEKKSQSVEVLLPAFFLRPAGEENVLGISVGAGGVLSRVGIAPWMEHAVQRQEMVFTLQ